ncbi:MAG TPA: AAA-associated domain-containing protein [Vicinamibacteria bacterium]|nr:AAA-associated domain-containing protein [Vicinamibacteria bacterium]
MTDAPQPLPHAPIGMVLGLLEHLREVPGCREDLYKLGGPLGYELDDLLPVTEAAKRLGLVEIASGDIELTEEGRALAAAEEPERKQRVGERLKGFPLIVEIYRAAAKGHGRVPRESFLERLEDHFSRAEAERQLSTALDWARYGEVFDFDPDSEEFFLA